MALFKAKTKNVDFYETESSLPSFYIDGNGFIMFDDPNLGGAAVLEVATHISTEAITHEDAVHNHETTELDINPEYEPTNDALFSDARGLVYPAWTFFLNSLHMQDPGDEPTHVQLLAKKCTSKEWITRIDYALDNAYRDYADAVEFSLETEDIHEALIGARAFDYITLLETLQEEVAASPSVKFDIRKLQTYITKFYLIVSYTPSSEGWWMDGRDTDYYITDNNIVGSIFKDNADGDKMTERIVNVIRRKADKKDFNSRGGQEDDFFWIRSDRTAQVISTRVHKLMDIIERWDAANPAHPMPFKLNYMDGREVAALIAFYPDILTPYWDKIWTLQSNQNEVLYTMDVQRAIDIGDTSIVDQTDLVRAIASDTVDMRHSQQEQNDFLSKYKGRDYKELGTLADERAALNWTAEGEEEEMLRQQELEAQRHADNDVWGRLDANDTVSSEHKTAAERQEEFLRRWRSQGTANSNDIRPTEDRQRKIEEVQKQREEARKAAIAAAAANKKPTFEGKPIYDPHQDKPVFSSQDKPVFVDAPLQNDAIFTANAKPDMSQRVAQQRQQQAYPQSETQQHMTQQRQVPQSNQATQPAQHIRNGQPQQPMSQRVPQKTGAQGQRQQSASQQVMQQQRAQQPPQMPQPTPEQRHIPQVIDDDVDPFA